LIYKGKHSAIETVQYRHLPFDVVLLPGITRRFLVDILPALKGEDSRVGILWFTT
jgi:hypothetical protein